MTPRGRVIAVRLGLILGGIVVAAIPAEILLTIQHHRMLSSRSQDAKEFDPFLQAVPAPGDPELHINALGFRGEEIEAAKPEGTFRVFVLGGSTALSGRVDFEESHARILEHALRAAYPELPDRIEVQNAGMHWHTTEHSIIKFLFKIRDLDPDLIIVFHGVNDLYRTFSPAQFGGGSYRSDYSHFHGPLGAMVDEHFRSSPPPRLHLVRKLGELLGDAWSVVVGPDEPGIVELELSDWKSLAAFERNLDLLARLVLAEDIELLLATQPYLYRADLSAEEQEKLWLAKGFFADDRGRASIPSIIRGLEEANRIAREIADRHGAGFVDLEAMVPKTLEYLADDVHYTPEGNSLIGTAFAGAILEAGWIDARLEIDRGPDGP